MKANMPTDEMWTLSDDNKLVRMNLPPVLIEGVLKPVIVSLSFSAKTIDDILTRLTVLRSQMLPAPTRN